MKNAGRPAQAVNILGKKYREPAEFVGQAFYSRPGGTVEAEFPNTFTKGSAGEISNVAALPTPLGKILEERTMPNGLNISKITVPLGVIGIIYEARPNVTFDVFSLCLKSGNACILKAAVMRNFQT